MRRTNQPRPLAAALAAAVTAACCGGAVAQPVGPTVVFGGAQVQQLGKSMLVTTSNGPGSNHSVIDWRSFSVPAGSVTHFQQPGVDSMSINRVTGNKPSEIFGTLSSNGRLVLVNPSGIAVGRDAVIDTAGFTASALSLSDGDAIAGRLRFSAGKGNAKVEVAGSVLARAGDVVLLGTDVQVQKDAVLSAPDGAVILAAGQRIALTGRGLEGIVMELAAPQDRAVNLGRLEGDAVGIFASQLRHTGVIQAQHVILRGDKVRLEKGGPKKDDGKGKDDHGGNGNNGNNGNSGNGSGNNGNGNGNNGNGGSSGQDAGTSSAPDVTGSIDTSPQPASQSAAPSRTGDAQQESGAPAESQAILSALVSRQSEVFTNYGAVVAGLQPPRLPGDDGPEHRTTRTRPDPALQCTR